jgi:hypothetical protein
MCLPDVHMLKFSVKIDSERFLGPESATLMNQLDHSHGVS